MPKKLNAVLGSKYNRVTLVKEVSRHITEGGTYVRRFECLCECGKVFETAVIRVITGHTKSCGCLKLESLIERSTKHGHAPQSGYSPEFGSWLSMRKRCLDQSEPGYPNYGGRGISICDRWLESFQNFLDDMGERPSPNHSIDRIDNDGNYCPENCRWATKKEQMRNKQNTIYMCVDGETRSLGDWCDDPICVVSSQTVRQRLGYGWDHKTALTKPSRNRKTRECRKK